MTIMANMASIAYAIEGSKDSLENIEAAIHYGLDDKKHWTEWTACKHLGFTDEELEGKRLGGEISDDVEINSDGVLKFWAEERWGLQDFEALLRQKFPDITVYWRVEESGCDVYCTNDREGKYFSDRYYVDICVDGQYDSEYFVTKEAMFAWLSNTTHRKIESFEDIEEFNSDYEDSCEDDENYISTHEFEITD